MVNTFTWQVKSCWFAPARDINPLHGCVKPNVQSYSFWWTPCLWQGSRDDCFWYRHLDVLKPNYPIQKVRNTEVTHSSHIALKLTDGCLWIARFQWSGRASNVCTITWNWEKFFLGVAHFPSPAVILLVVTCLWSQLLQIPFRLYVVFNIYLFLMRGFVLSGLFFFWGGVVLGFVFVFCLLLFC